MTPLILLLLGLLLIFIEFYVPGAVMGICGSIFIFASLVVFATTSESAVAITIYTIAVFIVLVLLVKFALWRIRTAKPNRSILSRDSQVGYQASSFDASLIGRIGEVITDLKPGGHILIDGRRLQAISQAGYLTKGTIVEVVGGQEESLIVKPRGNL